MFNPAQISSLEETIEAFGYLSARATETFFIREVAHEILWQSSAVLGQSTALEPLDPFHLYKLVVKMGYRHEEATAPFARLLGLGENGILLGENEILSNPHFVKGLEAGVIASYNQPDVDLTPEQGARARGDAEALIKSLMRTSEGMPEKDKEKFHFKMREIEREAVEEMQNRPDALRSDMDPWERIQTLLTQEEKGNGVLNVLRESFERFQNPTANHTLNAPPLKSNGQGDRASDDPGRDPKQNVK